MSVDHRLIVIRRLIENHRISSQQDLADLLADERIEVTQATVSRDLQRLGAIKIRDTGTLRYVVPEHTPDDPIEALGRALADYSRSMTSSQNLLVIKTTAGAAHVVAAAIDGFDDEAVIGTVAGDDTILVIGAEGQTGTDLIALFESIGA